MVVPVSLEDMTARTLNRDRSAGVSGAPVHCPAPPASVDERPGRPRPRRSNRRSPRPPEARRRAIRRHRALRRLQSKAPFEKLATRSPRLSRTFPDHEHPRRLQNGRRVLEQIARVGFVAPLTSFCAQAARRDFSALSLSW